MDQRIPELSGQHFFCDTDLKGFSSIKADASGKAVLQVRLGSFATLCDNGLVLFRSQLILRSF